MYVVKNLP